MFYITTLSQTFLNELLSLPRKISKKIPGKIKILETDPYYARGDAKKLEDRDNIYRVRVGQYRILYTIGENVVKVLSVRKREDIYANPQQVKQPDLAVITDFEVITPSSELSPPVIPSELVKQISEEASDISLPIRFTESLLKQWLIPAEHWPEILEIKTEEDLLNSILPEIYLNRILDNMYPRSIEDIDTQPALLLNDVEDLNKFLDGDITRFLLKLDPGQEQLRDFATGKPVLVKGGPGSGKSTLALYRVEKLLNEGYKPILFTTYTNALVHYSEQLLTQLLQKTPESLGVRVSTIDLIAKKYYEKYHGEPNYAYSSKVKTVLEQAIKKAIQKNKSGKTSSTLQAKKQILGTIGHDYILEEIENIILGRNIISLSDYLEVSRQGRGKPLQKTQRCLIWEVYQFWCQFLKRDQLITFEQLRCEALAIANQIPAEEKPYRAIIVDEAQDLSPTALRFLLALVPNFEGIYLTADASQSLYQKGFSWKEIHQDLNVTGRTLLLKRNYRNTQQIAKACEQILSNSKAGDQECVKQHLSPYQGDKPQLLSFALPHSETQAIKSFLYQAAKKHRLPLCSAAILCPNNNAAKIYAEQLNSEGLNAQYVTGKDIDIKASYIKVITLHSAKGLEFPFVVVALARSYFPNMLSYNIPPEEEANYLDGQKRLFYVGCSRAMRELLVTLPHESSPFFDALCPPDWQII